MGTGTGQDVSLLSFLLIQLLITFTGDQERQKKRGGWDPASPLLVRSSEGSEGGNGNFRLKEDLGVITHV